MPAIKLQLKKLQGDELAQALLDAAPLAIRAFLVSESIPAQVVQKGKHIALLRFREEKHGPIRNIDEAKRRVQFLREAWDSRVAIEVFPANPDSVEIRFLIRK